VLRLRGAPGAADEENRDLPRVTQLRRLRRTACAVQRGPNWLKHYFEGWRSLPTYPEERREWSIKNHNFLIE
jgi:hypothetical protein